MARRKCVEEWLECRSLGAQGQYGLDWFKARDLVWEFAHIFIVNPLPELKIILLL